MQSARLIESLERFPAVVSALTSGLAPARARWRPADGGWSMLEIVAHLADEEVEDFRARLALTLEDADAPWPPIAPEAWVRGRDYQGMDLERVLARFRDERGESVRWLKSLKATPWAQGHEHPGLGLLSAGDLLLSWAAHDALHLRQLARRLYQSVLHDGEGFAADYAGPWE